MIKRFFSLIYLLIVYVSASTQDRIGTDRPDQTESAWLTPKKYFQAEFGFNYLDVDDNDHVLTFPDMLLKYGVSEQFELQLGGQYISVHQETATSTTTSGLVPMELGIRVGLWEQKKILPKTSVIVRTGFPVTASKVFKTDHLPGLILLTIENAFTEHVSIGYNIGSVWDGDNPNPLWIYSASLGFDIAKNWEGFVEGFGAAQNELGALNSFDMGIGYYLSDNTKLDTYFGKRLSRDADRDFFGFGFSFRIDTRKRGNVSSLISSKY